MSSVYEKGERMTTTSQRVEVRVLAPSVSFRRLRRAFVAAGWRGGATTVVAPLVPGEPELGTWRRGGTVVRYDANPVVWLRVLRITGPALLPDLPELGPDDVEVLLGGTDRADQLLGLLVSAELRLAVPAVLAKVRDLAMSRDQLIAHAAHTVLTLDHA